MKRWIRVAPLVLLALLAASCRRHTSANNAGDRGRASADNAGDGRRHTEASGGFSFIPPEGWVIRDIPGRKFKVMVGPAAEGFAPNINIGDELFDGSLVEYVKASLNTLSRVLKNFRLVRQDFFETTAGLQGMRAVAENEQNDRLLRQTFYVFSKKNTKFVVTCTALAVEGDKLAPVFEASIKTFRFDAL